MTDSVEVVERTLPQVKLVRDHLRSVTAKRLRHDPLITFMLVPTGKGGPLTTTLMTIMTSSETTINISFETEKTTKGARNPV
jgi:hypothetical protein